METPDVAMMDENDGLDFDLRAWVARLWRGKWIIAVCVLFAATLGYLTATTYEPSYRAAAKVMFDVQNTEIIDLGNGAVAPIRQDGLQDQIEVLRSATLAGRVVDQLALVNDPEFNPRLRQAPDTFFQRLRDGASLPTLLTDTLSALGLTQAAPPTVEAQTDEEIAERDRRVVIDNVLSELSTQPIPKSQVIEVAFTSLNPVDAAAVANAFAEQYIVDQLNARLDATRAATEWLGGRVDELQIRVRTAEEAVEAARAELSFEAGQSLQITQEQLQALNASLSVARNSTRAAEATYNRLVAALKDEAEYGAVPEFRTADTIANNRARQADLLAERSVLSESVDATHPSIVRIDRILDETSRAMREEAQQIVDAAKMEWIALQEAEAGTEAAVRELETLALEQSRAEVTVRQLEREAEASRALYENFLGRLKETSEQARLEEPNARILTKAEPPLSPLAQRKNLILQISSALGVLAGLGIILALEHLNNTFRSGPQLEQLTKEPVLGVLPTLGRSMKRQSVLQRFRDTPRGSLAEAVRNLRTSILFSDVDNPPKVVMFTSSVPREGKSTSAMLVALTSRQMGRSAIIVDCDLRLPALADLLGHDDNQPGLLSTLNDSVILDDAIYKDETSGLHVLMTTKSEPRSSVNAADILSSKRFKNLIDQLKTKYDLVILDAPPTLAVSDPRILSSYTDAIVYVVKWDDTPRDAVFEGLKELKSVNAPVVGVVLSLVNEAKASSYAYQKYSYYRGKYRNYYSD